MINVYFNKKGYKNLGNSRKSSTFACQLGYK